MRLIWIVKGQEGFQIFHYYVSVIVALEEPVKVLHILFIEMAEGQCCLRPQSLVSSNDARECHSGKSIISLLRNEQCFVTSFRPRVSNQTRFMLQVFRTRFDKAKNFYRRQNSSGVFQCVVPWIGRNTLAKVHKIGFEVHKKRIPVDILSLLSPKPRLSAFQFKGTILDPFVKTKTNRSSSKTTQEFFHHSYEITSQIILSR